MTITAPYGSWVSPISAELAANSAISFTGLALDGRDTYWLEGRPDQRGRCTIMRQSEDGAIVELTPPQFSVRTTVHEYGGGAFAVDRAIIYFTNFADQRLYQHETGKEPSALTPAGDFRYADMIIDRARQRLICVREDHTAAGEPVNSIVAINIPGGGTGVTLASGNDFYSNPRLSPDGQHMAYLTWNHPNMPWDGCELRVAAVHPDGSLGHAQLVAGGTTDSVFQPEWSPAGVLHFVAENTGWWNLYRIVEGQVQALCPMQAELGRAMWVFGCTSYGFASATRILCCITEKSIDRLAWLDTHAGSLTALPSPYTKVDFLHCGKGLAAFVGGSPTRPMTVAQISFDTDQLQPIRQAFEVSIEEQCISAAQPIEFPTSRDRTAHALYYPPSSRSYAAPARELPPLIAMSHSGPTSSADSTLRYAIQYWTSRGFAVADVNYGGSTGYGREYRQRLDGEWGIVDVDDCCNAGLFLAEEGLADRKRLVIKGGSAGGYTTLACLAFRNDVFAAGSCRYGLADLESLTRQRHKFESHYHETLVGAYPERRSVYVARSPIYHIANLRCALILFQGEEDTIVPPAQSQMMFDAVRQRGLPTAYLLFRGEGHGFRQAASLRRAHEAELFFFSRVFGLGLPEPVEPLAVENLPETN